MDLTVSQMLRLQQELYEAHKDTWSPLEPAYGKDSVLYMVEEVGEVIAILKKKGADAVVSDPQVRAAFLEEMADVLMYYHDILLRFGVSGQEISQAYLDKHRKNMGRDYSGEYKELYHG